MKKTNNDIDREISNLPSFDRAKVDRLRDLDEIIERAYSNVPVWELAFECSENKLSAALMSKTYVVAKYCFLLLRRRQYNEQELYHAVMKAVSENHFAPHPKYLSITTLARFTACLEELPNHEKRREEEFKGKLGEALANRFGLVHNLNGSVVHE